MDKQQTKKTLTPLMQLVCERAAIMRECYRGSSWNADNKTQFNNKVKRNVPHASFSIEKVNMNERYIFLYV